MTERSFSPDPSKPREKILLLSVLLLAVGALVYAAQPDAWIPFLWRLFAVLLLTVAAMLFPSCLMRRCVYHILPREDAGWGAVPDFTVTEYVGKRRRVVCRISLTDIEEVVRITPQNRRRLFAEARNCRIYDYTGAIFPQEPYFLRVRDGETAVYLKIDADQGFISALSLR